MNELPQAVQKIIARAAARYPNDIDKAVSFATTGVQRLKDYPDLRDHLVRSSLRSSIHDAQHTSNTASGRTVFEREKQNSPGNPDLREWPESYFDESIWFDDWPRRLRVKTMALDPSEGSDARRGDYSAFAMLGVDDRGILYMEADMARRPTPQIVADGVEIHRRFKPDAFAVEANQFQYLLGAEFEAEFQRQGMLEVRPLALNNRVNKQVRIRRLGPYLSSKLLRLKNNSPSTRLLVEQLKDFPIGDHDDGPDAAEMAIRLAVDLLQP